MEHVSAKPHNSFCRMIFDNSLCLLLQAVTSGHSSSFLSKNDPLKWVSTCMICMDHPLSRAIRDVVGTRGKQARCPLPEQVQHDPEGFHKLLRQQKSKRRLLQTLGLKCSATFLSRAFWIHRVHFWPLCEKPDLAPASQRPAVDQVRRNLELSGTMDAS